VAAVAWSVSISVCCSCCRLFSDGEGQTDSPHFARSAAYPESNPALTQENSQLDTVRCLDQMGSSCLSTGSMARLKSLFSLELVLYLSVVQTAWYRCADVVNPFLNVQFSLPYFCGCCTSVHLSVLFLLVIVVLQGFTDSCCLVCFPFYMLLVWPPGICRFTHSAKSLCILSQLCVLSASSQLDTVLGCLAMGVSGS
jgi:hypothetical protein